MLHISDNVGFYLHEMDSNFVTTPRMSSGLETEIQKTYYDIGEMWEKDVTRIKRGMKSFENKLIKALSTPLPANYVGKPRPSLRKFPYSNSGELKNSWIRSIGHSWGQDNTMTIDISYGFTSPHAIMTNDGWNSGKRNVHWLHWVDNILDSNLPVGTKHSAKVPDIRAVLLGNYG